MKKLVSLDKIVVHPGKSHVDEIVAVMLAEASTHDGQTIPVFRRTPTEDDLSDNRTLVMDVGGNLNDWSMNFDHHQLPRDAAPECAFSLIAKEIGAAEDLEAFFAWYATWRKIDSKGPFTWACDAGVDWAKVSGLLSPVSEMVQDWFEEATGDTPVDEVLVRRLQAQGRKILKATVEFKDFCDRADQWSHPEFGGVKVMDFTWASPNDALDFGDAYAKARGITGGIIVSRDNRGPGLALFRRNDDPRVDFSVLNGNPNVTFAHNGGFIAKTIEGAEWAPLVRASIKA